MSKRWWAHCIHKTHAFQRVGDKPYKDSGACHISKIFRGLVVQGMPCQPLQRIGQSIASCTSHHEEKAQHLVDLFKFWRQLIPQLEILLWPIFQVTHKAASSERGPEQKRAVQQLQAVVQAVLPLRPYDRSDKRTPLLTRLQHLAEVSHWWRVRRAQKLDCIVCFHYCVLQCQNG